MLFLLSNLWKFRVPLEIDLWICNLLFLFTPYTPGITENSFEINIFSYFSIEASEIFIILLRNCNVLINGREKRG